MAEQAGGDQVRHRNLLIGATLVAAIVALGLGQRALSASAGVAAVTAPSFEVDPMWPNPLPNHWVLGNVIGVGVDANDHVFIVHRNDTFNATQEVGAVETRPQRKLRDEVAQRSTQPLVGRRRLWRQPHRQHVGDRIGAA